MYGHVPYKYVSDNGGPHIEGPIACIAYSIV
jgi:hypothetical protein